MMNQAVPNPRMQAEALKRMGRGPDTQLIHMTDSEIDALNGLSGLVFNQPLRTNPDTGLPEAGLFKRLLPTVLAIGASAFLGPSVGALFGKGAFATGLGTGLTAAGGHLLGQAVTGQDIDFGRAALAGAGSGLMAGFGAAGDATAGVEGAVGKVPGPAGLTEANVALSPAEAFGAPPADFSAPIGMGDLTAADFTAPVGIVPGGEYASFGMDAVDALPVTTADLAPFEAAALPTATGHARS
jgi:hypothetical protein